MVTQALAAFDAKASEKAVRINAIGSGFDVDDLMSIVELSVPYPIPDFKNALLISYPCMITNSVEITSSQCNRHP